MRTVGGFDVPISNWDGQWEWVPSLPEGVAGSVELVTEGEGPEAVHLVRVTGLADGATTTVTVLSSREDYLDGDASKEGQALTQARTPELGSRRRWPAGSRSRSATTTVSGTGTPPRPPVRPAS